MDPQLKQLLRTPISLAITSATVSIYGEAQVSTATTVMAYVQLADREFTGFDGQLRRTSHLIIVDASTGTPTLQSQVTLPGETVPRNPKAVETWFNVSAASGPVSFWQIFI